MKKYLLPLLNWRVIVLTALAIVAAFLILGDTDTPAVFLTIKVAGAGIAYLAYRLARYWDARGLIDELNVYSDNL